MAWARVQVPLDEFVFNTEAHPLPIWGSPLDVKLRAALRKRHGDPPPPAPSPPPSPAEPPVTQQVTGDTTQQRVHRQEEGGLRNGAAATFRAGGQVAGRSRVSAARRAQAHGVHADGAGFTQGQRQ